ncbi:MAG: GntR family transcriptional regulator [Spirochaetia bacterium]
MSEVDPVAASRYSLSAQVSNHILNKIAIGELAPGDRIVEARIASELRVSSIPVREAIRELVAKRVLEYVVHKGARVREVSMAETVDALQVKAVLEALAARLAGAGLARCTARLEECLRPMRGLLVRHDFVRFQDQNQRFHRAIMETSGNQILLAMWDSLAFEVRTKFILDHMKALDPEELTGEHENVLRAIEAGDTEGVAQLLMTHSHHLIEGLKNQITAHTAGGGEA